MIQEGDVVTAEVMRLESYGAYFDHEGISILVLGPDASPGGDILVEDLFKVGQQARVRVGHFVESDQRFRGYIHAE
ncbi:S1 RNA-binding domain-containing protein [Haloferula sp. BvORR071]|uniref:S1 RNA-binding domain-containing protein n=1 Tax=Haloferula sp. BvORR071 TaxID=1396141 RepID=UPI0005590CA7|nr:S1 RNA-binding domain-containing protein [Haloferula sp. BvORR071]